STMAPKSRKKNTIEGDGSKSKSAPVQKASKKKRRGVSVEDSNWTPEALKCAAEFMDKYSLLGVEGIKAEFKAEIEQYKSPTYGDVAFKANSSKNRHKDPPTCLDTSRVSLPEKGYINASWLYDLTKFVRQYILTQAPMDSTVEDFWKMCFEHKVMAIIVLCDMKENGQDVSADFWPKSIGDFKNYGTMSVANKKSEQVHKETVSTLEVLPEGCSNSQIMSIVQFNAWEANFTQSTGRNLLKIIRVISRLESLGTGPVVVMDEYSAISRAAILTIVDIFAALIYKGEKGLSLPAIVKWARQSRHGMIRSEEDYVSVIKTLFEYLYRTNNEKFKDRFEKICGKPEDLGNS
ncbi:hypothetical protein PFISCL1PPCAC_10046, partial [Pristionchus fissidentatus]